jgi:phosphoribosylformylglycinamidine cyclo-ligase
MLNIFNCGIGFVLVVDPEIKDEVLARLNADLGEDNGGAFEIGHIRRRQGSEGAEEEQVRVEFPTGLC